MPDHVFAPGGQMIYMPGSFTTGRASMSFIVPSGWNVSGKTSGVFEVQSIRVVNNTNKKMEVGIYFNTGLQSNTDMQVGTGGGAQCSNYGLTVAETFRFQIEKGRTVEVSDKSTPFYFKGYSYDAAPMTNQANRVRNTGMEFDMTNLDGGTGTGVMVYHIYYKYYLNRLNSTSTESQGLFRT
jgi:hypothetical protein